MRCNKGGPAEAHRGSGAMAVTGLSKHHRTSREEVARAGLAEWIVAALRRAGEMRYIQQRDLIERTARAGAF